MANTGTAKYNGRAGQASALYHYLPSGSSANFDISAYAAAAGLGSLACHKITPMAAVAAGGLVVHRQYDDGVETFTTIPVGTELNVQASLIVSSTVDLLIEW